jgi:hypothetical protein
LAIAALAAYQALTMPSLVSSASVAVEIPEVIAPMVRADGCTVEYGTVHCVLASSAPRPLALYPLEYETYDKSGVKLGSGTMTDTIPPAGKVKAAFPHGGKDVARIVVVDRWARSLRAVSGG